MKKILTLTFVTVFSVATAACTAMANSGAEMMKLEDVAPYPAAQAGQTRHVIWLDKKNQEDLLKVELVPGQVMQTDCNTRGLTASLTAKDLPGWGYTYYEVGDVNGPISTMMACPEGTVKEAFVPVQSDGFTLGYNSKLPIVVYAPEHLEVRYRIWKGSNQLERAVQQ